MKKEYSPLDWTVIDQPRIFTHKGSCLGSSVANGVNLLLNRMALSGDTVDRAARVGPLPVRNDTGIRIALKRMEQQIGAAITLRRGYDTQKELQLASEGHPILLPVNDTEWRKILTGRSVRVGVFEKVKRAFRTDHLVLVYTHEPRGDLNSVFDINAKRGYSVPRQLLEDIASEVFFLSK